MICKKAKQIVREREIKLEKGQLIEDKTKEEVLFAINNSICPYCGEKTIEENFFSTMIGRGTKRKCFKCKIMFRAEWYLDRHSNFKIIKDIK